MPKITDSLFEVIKDDAIERTILGQLMAGISPIEAGHICAETRPSEFFLKPRRELFSICSRLFERDGAIIPSAVVQAIKTPDARHAFDELFDSGTAPNWQVIPIDDALKRLHEVAYRRGLRDVYVRSARESVSGELAAERIDEIVREETAALAFAYGRTNHHEELIISAADLLAKEFPEPRFVVPDMIAEGATLVVGPPKLGKSWLMLGLAVAVASGGKALGNIDVEEGDVLYLALEDGERRLKGRLQTILQGNQKPPRLDLATKWKRLDRGGLERIDNWISAHPHARMVVIDVLKAIRPMPRANASIYDADYEAIAPLAQIARERVGLEIVHHTNKRENPRDFIESVSGSHGLAGACDTVMALKRERGEADATLCIAGRDVTEQELGLRFIKEHCLWEKLGDAKDLRRSRQRTAILEALASGGSTAREVADATGMPLQNVKMLLSYMTRDGEVKNINSKYSKKE